MAGNKKADLLEMLKGMGEGKERNNAIKNDQDTLHLHTNPQR